MNKFLLIFLSINLTFINILGQQKSELALRFPLDIPAVVTGSFGELRSNNFHAGIDFATNQTIGLPVYAVDDGYISRIFVSHTGYGKAVYINHPSGYTSVYGHFHEFSPDIEAFVTNLQYKRESFSIDYNLKSGEMPIKKGELIGKSGNSGNSSGPHLHFEMRETASQKPLNVHFFNFPIKDNVPPHIEAICIYPMDEFSAVNGRNEPLYIQTTGSDGHYQLKNNPEITASGNIGIGVEVTDYYPNSIRKCGVYSIVLIADEQKIFESRLDCFLFDNQRYINSHIDYERKITSGISIQKSFLDYNNKLNIYKTNQQRGVVEIIPAQIHTFKYEITDPAKNVSYISFTVNGIEGNLQGTSIRPMRINATQPYSTEIEGFKVDFQENSFYTDIPYKFSVEPNNGTGLGAHFHILDETIPIHKNFEIKIPISNELQNTKGLCGTKINKGRLVYVSSKISGNEMVLTPREGGIYTLSADSIAPVIRLLNVPQGRNYSNQKEIRIEIKDNFSGIKNYRCTINDKWQLFEYDAKNNVLIGYFDKMKIQKGNKHELVVKVSDNVGNEGILNVNIVY